jgi:hypothetical protein
VIRRDRYPGLLADQSKVRGAPSGPCRPPPGTVQRCLSSRGSIVVAQKIHVGMIRACQDGHRHRQRRSIHPTSSTARPSGSSLAPAEESTASEPPVVRVNPQAGCPADYGHLGAGHIAGLWQLSVWFEGAHLRTPSPSRRACAVLERAEDQLDGPVDFSGLRCVEAACEVSEAAGVDGSHLVD